MDKPLEVREFDSIICKKEYSDGERFHYLDRKAFENLVSFIHEFTGNEESAAAAEFMHIGFKKNLGDVVTIQNYVGLIQMKNGVQIQVLPKISLTEDEGNRKTKQIFLKMLRSMKDFPGKVFNDASLKIDKMNLYELFINMYLQEVRQLVKNGIKSTYVNQEENLNFFKGKLLMQQHIKRNISHKELFFVSFDEFHPNRPENKLVKATLLKLGKITASAENSKEIRQFLTAFENVETSINFEKDFSKVVIDRNTKDYEMLMQWSKVFLMNKSFTSFSGSTVSRALLFPMESVYESYVAQKMKKVFGPDGWNVSSQDKGHHLFDLPRKFSLRPDLVLRQGERIIIMDTKWKRLINDERKNYGISQTDMYQMYVYSKKYSTEQCQNPEVWLLYPMNENMKGKEEISFMSEDGVRVNLFFVDVENIEESIEKLKKKVTSNQE